MVVAAYPFGCDSYSQTKRSLRNLKQDPRLSPARAAERRKTSRKAGGYLEALTPLLNTFCSSPSDRAQLIHVVVLVRLNLEGLGALHVHDVTISKAMPAQLQLAETLFEVIEQQLQEVRLAC